MVRPDRVLALALGTFSYGGQTISSVAFARFKQNISSINLNSTYQVKLNYIITFYRFFKTKKRAIVFS